MPAAFLFVLFQLAISGGTQPRSPGQWGHRSWTIEEGLPQNTVTAVTQTPDGYLWLGTVKGVVRFDGTRFRPFESAETPGLAGDRVTTLLTDSQGRLWIGTESGGVSVYENGTFSNVTTRLAIRPAYIEALAESDLHLPGDRSVFQR